MYRELLLSSFVVNVIGQPLAAQGCDLLLRDGVFNTFNKSGYSYNYDEWHQAWCNKILSQSGNSSNTTAGLNVLLGDIPIGLSFGNAQAFQQTYQSQFCGAQSQTRVDLSTLDIVHRMADEPLIEGYVRCKTVETAGLVTTFANDPATPRAFVISMHWTPQVPSTARINVITFSPNTVTCTGDLAAGGTLAPSSSKTMLCTRRTDAAVMATIGSNAGVFYRTLAAVPPPAPNDQDRVLSALPRGTILGWNNRVPVPRGWQLCDGSNGTPDLNNRYIVGTTKGDEVGRNTGSETHTHRVTGAANEFHLLPFNPPTAFVHDEPGSESSNSYQSHGHGLDIVSGEASSRGPGTQIMFIVKL